MTHQDHLAIVKAIVNLHVLPVIEAKNSDYSKFAGDEDAHANFKGVAARMAHRVDQYDTWQVYFNKHLMAVERWLNSGRKPLESEPISGRILDCINYLIILWSMGVEEGTVDDPRLKVTLDKALEGGSTVGGE